MSLILFMEVATENGIAYMYTHTHKQVSPTMAITFFFSDLDEITLHLYF